MRLTFAELRDIIRSRTLHEARGAMKLLDVVEIRLIMSKAMKIEEILTSIRIIKGVATVNQTSPVVRSAEGSRILELLVTFDPQGLDKLEYIDAFAHVIKRIPDIRIVVVKTLNAAPLRDASGQRRLVY